MELTALLAVALERFERVDLLWTRGFGEWQATVNDVKSYGPTPEAALAAAVAKYDGTVQYALWPGAIVTDA